MMIPKSRTDGDRIPERGVTRWPPATRFQKVFDGYRASTCHVRHEENIGSRSRSARPRRGALAREPLLEPRVSVDDDVLHVVHSFWERTRTARPSAHPLPVVCLLCYY